MVETIKEQTTSFLFKVIIKHHEEEEMPVKNNQEDIEEYTSADENGEEKIESKELTPDSPCPCGSGKKYKNCCGRV